jgi:peptidyl-prolyl cis-trans isomerase C
MKSGSKILGLMLLSIIIGATPVRSEGKNDVVAVAGERTITAEEFSQVVIAYRKSGDFEKISQTLDGKGKAQLLDQLIDQKLMATEAARSGLKENPQVRLAIQQAIDRILAEAFLTHETEKLDLSDGGLSRFYADHPQLFTTPTRVKARHIVVQTEAAAESALKQIKKGRPFEEIASEVNIDSSRSKGGDLGWVSPGIMVKPFDDALFALAQGQVSPIVKTSFGYHIITVDAVEPGRVIPFESVKSDVKKQMIQRRISELKQILRKKYPVTVNQQKLNEIQ